MKPTKDSEEIIWSTIDEDKAMHRLGSGPSGITNDEALIRLKEQGSNEISREKKIEVYEIFFNQFRSFLVWILIFAAVLSFVVGEHLDSFAITAIIILNALLGFIQEYRANKAIEGLRRITSLKTIVIRAGVKHEINSKDLVVGDIIFLEEGRQVPGDLRLITTSELFVDESLLTGESIPVLKRANVMPKESAISEQHNMAFMGTSVTQGNGIGLVVRTGKNTEIGKIASLVQSSKKDNSPLNEKLDRFGKMTTYIILILVAVLFLFGVGIRGITPFQMLLVSISLAVAVIPEGLPAVITLTLAIGMQTMAKNKALINRLTAVETLGSTSIICSDKTGTLTKNEMTVRKIWCDGKMFEISGTGYTPEGEFTENMKEKIPENKLKLLLSAAAACNNASLYKEKEGWKLIGDPTEGALIVAAMKAGIISDKSLQSFEIPFTSERKMMSVVCNVEGSTFTYTKGAPESVINACNHVYIDGSEKGLDARLKQNILEQAKLFAGEAMRVLGIAYKTISKKQKYGREELESGLIFLGLVAMEDPPRPEVKAAIDAAHNAGIRTVMITGDHLSTAVAVAEKIGLMNENDLALTGDDVDKLNDEEFDKVVSNVAVYARVSPETKVRVLEGLKARGEVVAMTGDGVNDAPALKMSDIGIAMGLKGTDVAKGASDLILEDDNYSTIIKAVEVGRTVYSNILKFLRLMFAMNIMEVALIAITLFVGMPIPLLPLQILWINLVTDSLPALALAVEPTERDTMKKKPRNRNEGVFTRDFMGFFLTSGAVATLILLVVFSVYLNLFGIDRARTMTFTTCVVIEVLFAFNCRSEDKSIGDMPIFSNWKLWIAVIISIIAQAVVVYVPQMQLILNTVPLSAFDWVAIFVLSIPLLAISPSLFKKKTT